MSRLKEQRLWDAVRRNAPKSWWLQRVENVVVEGMPDVFIAASFGVGIWLELKAPIRPKRLSTRLLGNGGLRPSQINWQMKAATKGLRAFTLIRDDEGVLFNVPCAYVRGINELSTSDMLSIYQIKDWEQLWRNLIL